MEWDREKNWKHALSWLTLVTKSVEISDKAVGVESAAFDGVGAEPEMEKQRNSETTHGPPTLPWLLLILILVMKFWFWLWNFDFSHEISNF